MGILDLLTGFGQADAAPWTDRLASGLGSQGGLLQKFGKGRYGGVGELEQSGLADFLDGLRNGQSDPWSGMREGEPSARQPPGFRSGDLSAVIAEYLRQRGL
jgi:hypothetical protein